MPLPRHGMGTAVFGGRIYLVAGGERQSFAPINRADSYRPQAP